MAEVWAAASAVVVGVAGIAASQDSARKARNQAADAAKAGQVDINEINDLASAQALKNIELSRQLELQYNPENNALRSESIKSLLRQLGPNATTAQAQALIASRLGQSTQSDLLNRAVSQAGADLSLGGNLPLDVRNLVARNAAAKAGSVGDIRLGRDISARDLGLTSLQLQQQRLANAQSLGQADLGAKQFDANYLLNQGQLLQAMASGDYARALSAAQFGQSLQAPVVGLDPSAIANLAVGNSNAGASAGLQGAQIGAAQAQGAAQIGGQLLGNGLGGFANYYGQQKTPTVAYTAPAASSIPYYGYGFGSN